MKNIKIQFIILLSSLFTISVWAQSEYTLKGKVISTLNEPVTGAVLTLQDAQQATSREDGTFSFDQLANEPVSITIWYPGYYTVQQQINNRTEIVVMMIPEEEYKYNEDVILPSRETDAHSAVYTAADNIAKKDFILGRTIIDRQLSGQVAGLQIRRSSGMPGEGSYYNLRGIRSLVGDNAPLVLINGIPFLPDKNESKLINGYTRNIFQAYNLQDIQSITVLKGAEASMYGSMGSNGVILIKTEAAESSVLDTRVSYYGNFGTTWNNKRIPLLEGDGYKTYLTDVGLTRFSDMNQFYSIFPFLEDP